MAIFSCSYFLLPELSLHCTEKEKLFLYGITLEDCLVLWELCLKYTVHTSVAAFVTAYCRWCCIKTGMVISEVKSWSSEAGKDFFISFKGDKFLSPIMTGTFFFKTSWKQLPLLRPQYYVYVLKSVWFRMRNRWRVWGFLHSYYCIYSDIKVVIFFVLSWSKHVRVSYFF